MVSVISTTSFKVQVFSPFSAKVLKSVFGQKYLLVTMFFFLPSTISLWQCQTDYSATDIQVPDLCLISNTFEHEPGYKQAIFD